MYSGIKLRQIFNARREGNTPPSQFNIVMSTLAYYLNYILVPPSASFLIIKLKQPRSERHAMAPR